MIATSAFRMGINSNNIHIIIHIGILMSISTHMQILNLISLFIISYIICIICILIANLIQEAGRAGCDGNTATHFIFFNKKDIRINFSIIIEYQETLVLYYIL